RGVDYRVSEWGRREDPLIVYLHGFGDTGSTFQFVVDELQRDWFVIAPDWRGFGHTDVDTPTFWFPDYLADLDQLLQQYSPDRAVRLIGHSMGGNVAGLYAGAMPGRVEALVNLEGFGLPDSDPNDAPARYAEWLLRSREVPANTVRDDFAVLAQAIQRRNPQMTAERAVYVSREWAKELPDGRVQLRISPAHKLPNPVLYRRAEAEACWRNITAAVLLVAGRLSRFAVPDDLPFPQPTITWIEAAGHMLHFDQPRQLAHEIEEFLVKPVT
ncbi:MAG: alpha/beta hydrolase, partial [Gammaproteobacteria bacterium]|nr:alpha/beta hydrolase [Gammaproteobacteria bacterium]